MCAAGGQQLDAWIRVCVCVCVFVHMLNECYIYFHLYWQGGVLFEGEPAVLVNIPAAALYFNQENYST